MLFYEEQLHASTGLAVITSAIINLDTLLLRTFASVGSELGSLVTTTSRKFVLVAAPT
jgi:hypothetical protein